MTRNVVLICLDSVRKDFFDRYASRLRNKADIEVQQARAASSWSVPSHASIFTGKLPSEADIHTHNADFKKLSGSKTFLDDLPEHQSLGVSANIWAGSKFNFDSIFDEFIDVSQYRYFPEGLDFKSFSSSKDGLFKYIEFLKVALTHDHPLKSFLNGVIGRINARSAQYPLPKPFDDGGRLVSKYARSLVARQNEPYFLFMNIMEAHLPHQNMVQHDQSLHNVPSRWHSSRLDMKKINVEDESPNPEDINNFIDIYSASIEYLDRLIDSLIEELHNLSSKETTVIITSDHGENLYYPDDDFQLGHTGSLSDALLHVPLCIVNPPKGVKKRSDKYLSHLELGEIITKLGNDNGAKMGQDHAPAELIGVGLDAWDLDQAERKYWDRMQRCVYTPQNKYVWDSLGNKAKFGLDENKHMLRGSEQSLSKIPDTIKQHFREDIQGYKEKFSSRGKEVNDATKRRLEDMGYL
ncbi:MAG: sulfatase-like hydrolase/transferase [Halobacteriaceae archaeon]